MKLYYKPGACSLAPHIVAVEAGIALELVKVGLAAKRTVDGQDYLQINPNGYVPALALDDGEVLTEVPVLVQYLADQVPDSGLIPAAGTLARYRVLQALSFISTELHKNFGPLFRPGVPEQTQDAARELLARRIGYVESQLADKPFVAGDTFSVADAYLWTVLSWTRYVKIDLSPYPNVLRWQAAVGQRPAVKKAVQAEGLA